MPRSPALAALADNPGVTAFLVDYDGSLAPIVDDPAAARPHRGARRALARLVQRFARTAVVSGRPVAFLMEHLAIDGLDYVGLYGLERVLDGELLVAAGAATWVPTIAAAADEAERSLRGLLIERKGDLAVTIHWRRAPERAAEAQEVAAALSRRYGIEAPLRGRMAVELRPPVPVDKGTVTEALADGMRYAAFAGDDAGDLPAFAALRRLHAGGALDAVVSIGVRSSEAPPEILEADTLVDGPAGLAALMDGLADAIGEGDRPR